ncbi:MAG TPA: N-acetylmuramoyl-L-alanine amidase [Roseiflexaceae bacterium]|nr:N-acetylmuramoyl-L-alanine amidase [Roseiflexaceae bacterium]
MTHAPDIRQLPAPRSAHASRRGAAVELIVLGSDPRPAAEALAAYTAPGSASAPHYYVAADGSVMQLVPEARAARHSGRATWRRRRRNIDRISVGIALENAPGTPYAPAQLEALDLLATVVAARHELSGEAVLSWAPPAEGEGGGTLTPAHLPAFLPQPARGPAVLGAEEEEVVVFGAPTPAVLGAAEDMAAGQRLWLELQQQAFLRRGGIGFQPGWALHLHAAKEGLGAPLAPSAPESRRIRTADGPYGYQPFARDTLFHYDRDWTGVQSLSQAAAGVMPKAGTLAFMLLERSYDDAIAAGPQPPAGKTGLKPEQAMPLVALKERLGPALSGNYVITVAGASYAVQVFAGDTLYTPIAPAGQSTNWGVVQRLSQEPPGPLQSALWAETYKAGGAPFDPASPFHQAAARERLGAPLSPLFQLQLDGQAYDVQVFALDTLYAPPGQAPRRASALPKPETVTNWKATPPAQPQPPAAGKPGLPRPSFAPPAGDRASASWPPPPGFPFIPTQAERERLFGKYQYRVNGDRTVTITDGWAERHMVEVPTPMLAHLRISKVKFLDRAAPQLEALLRAWAEAGLIDRIISWDGTFVPRLMRKLDNLSAHSWGTAFDINAALNGQGVRPPLVGQRGSVRELVSLANQFGFFWGGHFGGGFIDGMHFEVAVLL